MKFLLPLLALLVLIGCAHTAKPITGPDPTAMRDHARKAAAAVADAKAHVDEATKHLEAASNALEGSDKNIVAARALFDLILPKLDALPLSTPADIKMAVVNIDADMSNLRVLLNDGGTGNATSRAELLSGRNEIKLANVKFEEFTTEDAATHKAMDGYTNETGLIVTKYNEAQVGWAKDSKALAWYRLHWFIGWIVLVAGVLGCVLIAILKFTGKLAIGAAKVAV